MRPGVSRRLPPSSRQRRRPGRGLPLADPRESIRGRLERVKRPRIPAGRDHAKGVGPPIHRTVMNVSAQETTRRGERLLVAHLESLDPRAVQARERLQVLLRHKLARQLVLALPPPRSDPPAAQGLRTPAAGPAPPLPPPPA